MLDRTAEINPFNTNMCSFSRFTARTTAVLIAVVFCSWQAVAAAAEPAMSDERAVFQTPWGDIHFGFYPDVSRLQFVTLGALHEMQGPAAAQQCLC